MRQRGLLVLVSLALVMGVVGFAPAGVTKAAPNGNGVPILYYDFENNTTRTTFENLVEQAVNSGSGPITRVGNITIVSAVGGAGTFNGGVAAGQAATGNNWDSATTDPGSAATNYYQFVVNTTGFSQISISFDNQASATGPARVGVLYSTDGSTFAATTTALTGNAAFATATFDLTSLSDIDNQSSVTIRLYAYAGTASDRTGRSAFGTGGTFRIDNLTGFAKTATASKTLLDYPAIGLSIKSGTAYTPTYTDFAINGGGITLASNLNLSGTLALTSGDLTAGANLVNLGSNAIVTGAYDVVGTVRRTSPTTGSPLTFNNAQTTINFATAPTQMDVTLTKSTPVTFTYSLPREYTLTPGTGAVNATVQLAYKPAEVPGGTSESNIVLWRLNPTTGQWDNMHGTLNTTDLTWHWVSLTGVTEFSRWTQSGLTPTAITLSTFSGGTPTNNGWIIVILLAAVALLAGGWALRRRTQA